MMSLEGSTAQQEAWAAAMARSATVPPLLAAPAGEVATLRRLAAQNAELQSQLCAAVASTARDDAASPGTACGGATPLTSTPSLLFPSQFGAPNTVVVGPQIHCLPPGG